LVRLIDSVWATETWESVVWRWMMLGIAVGSVVSMNLWLAVLFLAALVFSPSFQDGSPVVRPVLFLWRGPCWYCVVVRAFVGSVGGGWWLGSGSYFGAGLFALSVLLSIGDRLWPCDVEDDS
jgi:hypothetical protein